LRILENFLGDNIIEMISIIIIPKKEIEALDHSILSSKLRYERIICNMEPHEYHQIPYGIITTQMWKYATDLYRASDLIKWGLVENLLEMHWRLYEDLYQFIKLQISVGMQS
jgi:hypothetical protein